MKYAPAISLGLSLVLGLTAFFILRAAPAEGGVDDAPVPTVTAPPEMIEIFVVAEPIEAGAPVSIDDLTTRDWPKSAMTREFLTDASQLTGPDGAPLIAQTELTPGVPLMTSGLGSEPPRQMLSKRIPDGFRAVSISVTTETGVAGFVLPGDQVDLTAYHEVPGRVGPDAYRPESLFSRVLVLGVDQVMSEAVEGALPVSLVTLALKPDDAARLTAAARNSRIGLALVGQAETEAASDEPVEKAAPSAPANPAPVRARTVSAPRQPAAPESVRVKVVHGAASTTVTAPVAIVAAPVEGGQK